MPILHLRFQKSKNLKYIYAIRVLRELVNKLVIFFLPLYFFNLHLPIWDQVNLSLISNGLPAFSTLQIGIFNIALSHVLSRLICFLSAIPIAKIQTKFGIQHGFVLGHLLYAVFVLLLFMSKANPYFAILAMAVDGFQMNFFWNSYYYSLSRNSNENKMGSNLGVIKLILNLLAMVSPALGGLIITSLGYSTLFLLGLVVILVGVIFSLLLDNVKVHDKISWKEFKDWMQEPGFRRLALTFSGRYFNDAMVILWPLYMFILLGSTEGVGTLYSLSLFLAFLLTYLIGGAIDKNTNRKPYLFSGGLLSILWMLRSFFVGIWSIAVINTIDKLTSTYHWLFFDRAWILRGKGRQALSYFVYREMIMSAAAVLFWILVFFLFYFFGQAWTSLFAIAAIGVLLTLLVREHKGPS